MSLGVAPVLKERDIPAERLLFSYRVHDWLAERGAESAAPIEGEQESVDSAPCVREPAPRSRDPPLTPSFRPVYTRDPNAAFT